MGSLNVNGLKRRLCYPEFIELIRSYDIFCILETNLDQYDIVEVKGYTFYGKFRNTISSRKSGGIGIYIKDELYSFIDILDNTCDYIVWLIIKQSALTIDDNVLIGVIYIPPTGSRYLDEDHMQLLDDEISRKCLNFKYALIIGDVNARTACLPDYVVCDDFLASHFQFDSETTSYFHKHEMLEKHGHSLKRKSKDKKTNPHGYFLIEICRNLNLFLLNGRVGCDKDIGEFTFRNKSVIDYAMSSSDLLSYVNDFNVMETDPLFSDGHAVLSVSILCRSSKQSEPKPKKQMRNRKWNVKLNEKFVNNIDITKLNNLLLQPDSKDAVNQISAEISNIFEIAAQRTFKPKYEYNTDNNKPWFGPDCNRARKAYHRAKKHYQRHKNLLNKNKLSHLSKQYKKTMHKHINKYKYSNEQKLRNMHGQNPKQYWSYIKRLKPNPKTKLPPTDELHNFFKESNANTENEAPFELPHDLLLNSEEQLNCQITESEILTHIAKLKNSKASCPSDNILNEYIISTKHIMVPVYIELFNKILNTGILPECWLEGYIIPIYKKGDSTVPSNYRPITLLSCLGKLFTSILNTRITNFVEENDLLNENQAGFRKQYSTVDHIFLLHSIIELLKKNKKKLYCAFIDFAAAFDSVWRIGVWQKLLSSSINGKLFRLIFNMYKEIKSCVFNESQTSAFFACERGLRQGENLSPIIFSMFLNDLESSLLISGARGLNINYGDEHKWLKLLVLLYADDTLIISEDPVDFQNSLDYFANYCREWKLKVNFSKSNVIVFGARNTNRYQFKLGDENINIVAKYKYLGIFFTSNGSFATAKKHLTEQAKKAMYMLYSRINNSDIPIDLQLKLFDHTIVPILTYGCEVWGFESLKIIEKIHNDFLRKITKTRKSTPIYMLHGELGRHPLSITVKCRLIGYWNRLITGKDTKYAYLIYLSMIHNINTEYKWPKFVQSILTEVGRPDLWINQSTLNNKSIKVYVKRSLLDQYLQTWSASTRNSNKGKFYNSYKISISLEKYLTVLPYNIALNILRLRTANHRFPIETGRWSGTELSDRICNVCNLREVGSEKHYILICPYFSTEREQFIPACYRETPNDFALTTILTNENREELFKLSRFASIIMNKIR
ncbi:MAG: reverse transcriptase family protein [Sedimenticola sp.]